MNRKQSKKYVKKEMPHLRNREVGMASLILYFAVLIDLTGY